MRRAKAFTLIEVILAIGLSVGMAAAVIAFYYQAVQTRAILSADLKEVTGQRVLMDRMADELQGAMSYPFLGMALNGVVDEKTNLPSLTLMTACLPGPAAWAEPKITEKPITPEQDLQVIGYRLSTWTDEFDKVHVTGLERTCQKLPTAQVAQEGKEISVSKVSGDVKFLRLRYFDGVAWMDQWATADLPLAVEITLGRDELPEGAKPEDYAGPTVQRTVFLPGGSKAMGTLIIREPRE